jgi:predicted DNA-binding protein (UPF0251 family)
MENEFYPRCLICKHPDQAMVRDYEAKILRGEIFAAQAAREMGVEGSRLSRHMNNCVKKRTAALTKPEPLAIVMNAVNAVNEQYEIVKDQLQNAIEGGKIPEIATMLAEGRRHIELHAKLTGQLTGPTNQVNLLVQPEFVQLRETIVNSLDPIERSKLSKKLLAAADASENVELTDIVDQIDEVKD